MPMRWKKPLEKADHLLSAEGERQVGNAFAQMGKIAKVSEYPRRKSKELF